MSIDTNLAEVLRNLQPTAEVILKARESDYESEDFEPFMTLITPALRHATEHYHGGDFFLRKLRDGSKPWTLGQARAVANIYRRALRGEPRKGPNTKTGYASTFSPPPAGTSVPAPAPATKPHRAWNYKCFDCNEEFEGDERAQVLDRLYQHRHDVHGKSMKGTYNAPNTPEANSRVEPAYVGDTMGPVTPVLPDYVPSLMVDLRAFLPARFAVEDNTGTLRFFIVTELKRRACLTGKFVWTKYRYANEYLEKGDRTVREQSGDTKKLIGKQRMNQPVYFGEEEALIAAIADNPAEAMVRYGKEKGCCAYCGRSLTDELSRSRGIGPDCWEAKHVPQMLRLAQQAVATHQASMA
jgi:hypothetical protein